MYKIDLHTHSEGSPDGALRIRHYRAMLERGGLDAIAVTDHDTIALAEALRAELGDRIIIGEEISTMDGEIIGLYLQQAIPPGLSARQTVRAIKAQHGLVYVPHPFETVRKGLSAKMLDSIAADVDIIEIRNGRAVFQNKSEDALHWAALHGVAGAASSDAHGWRGWGRTYSMVSELPTAATLVRLLERATHNTQTVGWVALAYPKFNRLRGKLS